MELRQFEHFLAVAREGSFTAAAQRAHIVQSALSASVRKLEAELGAQLFERTTRRVILTEAGRALIPVANRLLADLDLARGEVAAVSGLSRGRVGIGTVQTLTVIDLPQSLGVFRSRYPGIRIHVRDGAVPDLVAALDSGELDLAFLAFDGPLPSGLSAFAQWSQVLVLVTYPGHRLASSRQVGLADLDDEPFVEFSGSVMQTMVSRRFADAGIRHNIVCTATHVPLLVDLVTAGLGVTILPEPIAARSGLPYAEISAGNFTRTIYLAGRTPVLSNPSAGALLEHLTEPERTAARTRPE